MATKFDEIKSLYPNNFSAVGARDINSSIPNLESFIGQVYFIRGILQKYGIVNCDLSKIKYVETSEKYTHGIPTYGRFYVYPEFHNMLGCPFPDIFPKNDPKYNLVMLSRYWNDPQKIVMGIMIDNMEIKKSDRLTGPRLLIEMSRYELILKMMEIDNSYEGLNVFERWLITSANDRQDTDFDYIFDARKLDPSYHVNVKMAEELVMKKLPATNLDRFMELIKIWLESKNTVKYVDLKFIRNIMRLTSSNGTVFIYTFPQEMFIELLSRGSPEELACVVLRYACILQQAQQWAKTNKFYDIFVNQYGGNLEGFASPLNSRIILQSKAKNVNFCSLFRMSIDHLEA